MTEARQRYLLFDSECRRCSNLAQRTESAADGRLTARSIHDAQVLQLLDAAYPRRRRRPLLLETHEGGVHIYGGIGMTIRLLRVLGLRRAWRVVQALGSTRGNPTNAGRRRFLRSAAGTTALALIGSDLLRTLGSPLPAAHAQTDCNYNCSCVVYVEAVTAQLYPGRGLPGGYATAAEYTESVMNSFGYYRIHPANTPSGNYIAASGAVMVWDAWQKGAYGDGHMAMVVGDPMYIYNDPNDPTGGGVWSIDVTHVDWPLGDCCVESKTFNTWGDLYGVNFYKPALA